ncbi:hypothetical protein GCM10009090_20640 [[Pseudomonas] boreopolis]|uniref:Uncharacterized protein n=1 Tax=Xanthomonas boreopolis TaxID=86183 RepID=A0A919F8B6_9XANT|nr:hypothetical protein GCM10009090_20640 [[Pseudomonas] boreopolis]
MHQEDRPAQLLAQAVGQEIVLPARQLAVVDHQPGRFVDHRQDIVEVQDLHGFGDFVHPCIIGGRGAIYEGAGRLRPRGRNFGPDAFPAGLRRDGRPSHGAIPDGDRPRGTTRQYEQDLLRTL